MTAHAKRLASKTRKAPLLQAGEAVIEFTRFLFASIVLVYVVVLVSPQGLLTPKGPWMKPLQSTEWTDSLLLELRPVMNISNTIRHEKQEAMSSHFITLSPDASEWA
jgi:hypothetical protein